MRWYDEDCQYNFQYPLVHTCYHFRAIDNSKWCRCLPTNGSGFILCAQHLAHSLIHLSSYWFRRTPTISHLALFSQRPPSVGETLKVHQLFIHVTISKYYRLTVMSVRFIHPIIINSFIQWKFLVMRLHLNEESQISKKCQSSWFLLTNRFLIVKKKNALDHKFYRNAKKVDECNKRKVCWNITEREMLRERKGGRCARREHVQVGMAVAAAPVVCAQAKPLLLGSGDSYLVLLPPTASSTRSTSTWNWKRGKEGGGGRWAEKKEKNKVREHEKSDVRTGWTRTRFRPFVRVSWYRQPARLSPPVYLVGRYRVKQHPISRIDLSLSVWSTFQPIILCDSHQLTLKFTVAF